MTKLHDKQDSFPFDIVHMSIFNSNTSGKTFYSSLSSEIINLARNASNRAAFTTLVYYKRLSRINKQGRQINQSIYLSIARSIPFYCIT